MPNEFITNCYKIQGKVLKIHPIPVGGTFDAYNFLQFQIEHIPICTLFSHKPSALTVEMVGVWSTADGIEFIKNIVNNKEVWLKLYGTSQNADIIYSSIQTKWVIFLINFFF